MDEAIFSFTPRQGKIIPDNRYDFESFLLENEGEDMIGEFKLSAKTSAKLKMYRYLFKVIFGSAVRGYTYRGDSGIDKVVARWRLQSEFAKGESYNSKTKQVETHHLSLAKMSKPRLLKFMQDCIFFIETDLQQQVPDSQTYKEMILTKQE